MKSSGVCRVKNIMSRSGHLFFKINFITIFNTYLHNFNSLKSISLSISKVRISYSWHWSKVDKQHEPLPIKLQIWQILWKLLGVSSWKCNLNIRVWR
jgi:hypothetical protein